MTGHETVMWPDLGSAARAIGPDPMTIGYLTSVYARASDTFVRGEVAVLRNLGHTVHTFSVRRPGPDELIGDEVRREHANTEFLLAAPVRMALAAVKAAFRSPRRLLGAARLAAQIGAPGIKGRLWPWAYLLEAVYLAELLRARRVQHLHNHIGENSAAVAMLAAKLAGIPYSLTIHGPGEFDRPTRLALDKKAHHAAFVATISSSAEPALSLDRSRRLAEDPRRPLRRRPALLRGRRRSHAGPGSLHRPARRAEGSARPGRGGGPWPPRAWSPS